ncbi:MAG: four-carbon acid sugar kinase family protein [Oscillospiraceae bacterium]|nr:four-carbon acid sugar kinase family protein [Oscillospiraceae bacterium]
MDYKFYLGVAADDFTGAGDAASFLAGQGLRTFLINGLPRPGAALPECDAVVIALKSRSLPAERAVRECSGAFEWLRKAGAEKLYFKYCSTFDSTPAGNIGPVADYMLDTLCQPFTVLCPGLPVNGREVKDGVLYVNGQPLAQSPMRNHPLNPMWDSRIDRLMAPQSAYPCLTVSAREMEGSGELLHRRLEHFARTHNRFYLIPDHTCDADAENIVRQFGGLQFFTGGSGLMGALARRCPRKAAKGAAPGGVWGDAVLMAGSCSTATGAQVQRYIQSGAPALAVDPRRLLEGSQTLAQLAEFYKTHRGQAPLFYTVPAAPAPQALPEEKERHLQAGALLEDTFAALAAIAREMGAARFIIAGGETSGAVARRLDYQTYRIGASVAPGVPVMAPVEEDSARVVYKSGNFGDVDFFAKALALTGL